MSELNNIQFLVHIGKDLALIHCGYRLKTKKAPNNSRLCGGKELMNQWHQSRLTKMGHAHKSFRAPDKEAVNLEAQRNRL